MLFPATRSALAIAHAQNLDLISKGTATPDEVWHLVEQALTWSRVAQLLGQGEPEMAVQVDVATQVVQRFQRTGRVGFSGTEYQSAKFGLDVMDELARLVDQPTASQAVAWSEAQVAGLRRNATVGGLNGAAAREAQRVFNLNQALTEQGNVTLSDLVDLGLATVAGNLSTPRGYWSCPWCWMDYVRPGYRQPNVRASRETTR